jgi:type IV pilus assembly protein PilC
MPINSTTRHRLSRAAARLLALRKETMPTTTATAMLIADGSLPPNATIDASAPLASALRNAVPTDANEIVDFVRRCESNGRGDDALGLLAQMEPPRGASNGSLVIIACEFIVLMVVLLIYALIVLPELSAVFSAYGVKLPAFTRDVFAVVTLLLPVIVLAFLLLLVGLLWRSLPFVFGPLLKPLDRLVLALPAVGPMVRHRNSVAMAGWLGFAPAEEASFRAAVSAARVWSRGILSRVCTRVLAQDSEHSIVARLAASNGFDREFTAAAAMSAGDDAQKAWRAQWNLARERRCETEPSRIAPLHIALGIVIATLVIAMYLPIFQIGMLN